MVHHNYRNIDKLEAKMRSYQNLNYALIGGFVVSVMAACLWAFVTVGSGYQIGLMAIVVGAVVGIGVRYFGAGYDPIYSVIGGVFALLSCLLGNLLSQIGFYMSEESVGFMQTVSFLGFGSMISIIIESFTLMDLLFYGIAVYEGLRFSRRSIEPNTNPNDSLEPPLSSLRGPLVGTISISLLGLFIYQTLQSPSEYTYYYETGEKMSVGTYSGGLEDGDWEYYYTNGLLQSKGAFDMGKKIGDWTTFYENGQLESKTFFEGGLETGKSISYYNDGGKLAETTFMNGRLNGMTTVYHENGKVARNGEYVNDREQGPWSYYYENGNSSAVGKMEAGEYVGIWKYYLENGDPDQVLDHTTTEDFKIIDAYGNDGNQLVKNGDGHFYYLHDNGTVSSKGEVKAGKQVGDWSTFDEDGKLTEEGYFKDDVYYVKNSWNSKGQHVKDHNGVYKMYSEETGNLLESGEIKNGLKSGKWIFYYDSLQIPFVESFFANGKLEGELIQYHETGEVMSIFNYKDGNNSGTSTWFDEYGTKISEVVFENNLKEGVQSFWNGSGVMTKQEIYENGVLIETK